MADKLIRVNSRVSVMASQVAYVIAPEFRIVSTFTCSMAALKSWNTLCVTNAGALRTALNRLLTMR